MVPNLSQIGKLANWLKGSGSALLCLRPLVLITGKYNWGDGDEAYAQYNCNKIVQPSIPLPLVTLSSTSLNMGLAWRGVPRYLSLLPDLALSQVLNKLVRKSPSCTDTSLPRGAWTPRLAHTLWNIDLAPWSYLWFWLLSFTWKIGWKKSSEECVVKTSSVMNMLCWCWYSRLKIEKTAKSCNWQL